MDLGKWTLIIGLLLSLFNLLNWAYKYFNGAYKIKKDKQDSQVSLLTNSRDIEELKKSHNEVMEKLDALFEVNKIQTRYTIVDACTTVLDRGHVEQYQLQSLEDMYSMYTDVLNANSYVSTLIKRVRRLEIKNGNTEEQVRL